MALIYTLLETGQSISFPLFTGILAATLHVLSGPDHLAAVAPLTVEKHNKSWKIGLFWGFGHLSGMLLIGVLVTLFRDFIPVEKISSHSEQLVGLVLILIGLWSFWQIGRKPRTHQHPHIHTEDEVIVHIHKHAHGEEGDHQHSHKHLEKAGGNWAAFSVGTLHGLAGVSHFILFLPTLSFGSAFNSALYLLGFAIGTVLAMVVFSVILGKITQQAVVNHRDRLFTGIRFAAGLIAILVGLIWIFQN
jgi:ABC-type nickel/cobalt efflux system permease component RcnA